MEQSKWFERGRGAFRVIYTWRGERHVLLQEFRSQAEADIAVRELRGDGWNAWWELVR